MLTKYTEVEAAVLITKAYKEATKVQGYRFGQALWNLMDNEITTPFVGTDKDFFHSYDIRKIKSIFYTYFVVGGSN